MIISRTFVDHDASSLRHNAPYLQINRDKWLIGRRRHESTRKMLTLPLDIAVSGGGRLASSENWSPLYILAPLQRSGTGRFRFRYTRPTGSQETFIISKKGQPTTFALGISSVTGHLLHSIKWRNWRLLFGAWQPTLGFPRPSLFSFIVIDFFVYPSPFNPAFDFFPHPIFHCIFITYVWYNFAQWNSVYMNSPIYFSRSHEYAIW